MSPTGGPCTECDHGLCSSCAQKRHGHNKSHSLRSNQPSRATPEQHRIHHMHPQHKCITETSRDLAGTHYDSGNEGETGGRTCWAQSILHHSMEGTSSNGISNSTHNRGSQRTCARTESSMAEQYEYIASMAPPFCRFPDDGKQPLAQVASGHELGRLVAGN